MHPGVLRTFYRTRNFTHSCPTCQQRHSGRKKPTAAHTPLAPTRGQALSQAIQRQTHFIFASARNAGSITTTILRMKKAKCGEIEKRPRSSLQVMRMGGAGIQAAVALSTGTAPLQRSRPSHARTSLRLGLRSGQESHTGNSPCATRHLASWARGHKLRRPRPPEAPVQPRTTCSLLLYLHMGISERQMAGPHAKQHERCLSTPRATQLNPLLHASAQSLPLPEEPLRYLLFPGPSGPGLGLRSKLAKAPGSPCQWTVSAGSTARAPGSGSCFLALPIPSSLTAN